MKRNVIVYIACSQDGFIADKSGSVSWLDEASVNIDSDFGYVELMNRCDTVLIGRTTYEQIINELSTDVWPYADKDCYVITSQITMDKENVYFRNDLFSLLTQLLKQAGKDIWVCGGAKLIQSLMKQDCIDEFQIWIAPIKLDQGIKAFDFSWMSQNYKLKETKVVENMKLMIFTK